MTDFSLCYGQSSRALQRQSKKKVLAGWAWGMAASCIGTCEAACTLAVVMLQQVCWLSCTTQQPRGTYTKAGRRKRGRSSFQSIVFLLILLFSEPTWSRSSLYGKRLTAGVTATRALLSCPWCLVDVCLQHCLQQPNPAAAVTSL